MELKRPRSLVDSGSGSLTLHKDKSSKASIASCTSNASWLFYKQFLPVSIAKQHPFPEKLLKLLLFYSFLFIQQPVI